MQRIYSFFCGIAEIIMNISKKTYRTCAIITTGVCVVSVVAFASNSFGGSGKNSCYNNRGFIVSDAEESDEETSALEELELVLETQSENLESYFSQNEITNVSVYMAEYSLLAKEVASVTENVKDTVMDTEEDAEAKEMIETTERLSAEITVPAEEVVEVDEAAGEETEVVVPVEEVVTEVAKADSIITTSGIPIEGVVNAPIEVTEEEYNILLHIVAAESGVCDVYAQMLVANVVINRVNDKHFPDTIEEVVFQKNQFSPATNGRLWNATVYDSTIEAVNRVLAGEDYSGGALFFIAKKYVSETTYERFNTNYKYLFEHDGHTFFKFHDK